MIGCGFSCLRRGSAYRKCYNAGVLAVKWTTMMTERAQNLLPRILHAKDLPVVPIVVAVNMCDLDKAQWQLSDQQCTYVESHRVVW